LNNSVALYPILCGMSVLADHFAGVRKMVSHHCHIAFGVSHRFDTPPDTKVRGVSSQLRNI